MKGSAKIPTTFRVVVVVSLCQELVECNKIETPVVEAVNSRQLRPALLSPLHTITRFVCPSGTSSSSSNPPLNGLLAQSFFVLFKFYAETIEKGIGCISDDDHKKKKKKNNKEIDSQGWFL